MAHELEVKNGKAMMAYAGQTPWHGLGKLVPPDLSPAQMLKAAGLDWTVEKVPSYATLNGKKVRMPWDALVRTNDHTMLSAVSQDWKMMQNLDAFSFFQEYCEAGDMEMHTAGSLRNGQIVWALAKVKDSFTIGKKDKVDSYLLFVNPHVWAKNIEVRFTPTRVVCMNTLQLSLHEKTKESVKVSHKKEFDAKKVKELLGIARHKMEGYKERATFLAAKQYTEEKLKEYFKTVFPVYQTDKSKPSEKEISKSALRAIEVVEIQPGAKMAPGSWWNAFNAVTLLTDHEIGRTDDSRLYSAWFGTGQQRKMVALNEAIKMAEAT